MFAELADYITVGVDRFFTDQSDIGFAAREDFLGHRYGVEHPQSKAAAGPDGRLRLRRMSAGGALWGS
jgi:hypothetical protein